MADDNVHPTATEMDYPAHFRNYDGFLKLFKYGAIVSFITAIVVMAMLSLRVRAIEVPLGAVLFMVSDSLISLEKFLWQAAWVGPLVWITYALAQLVITRGMLKNTREDAATSNSRD